MRRRGWLSVGLLGRLLVILLVVGGVEFAASTFLYERSSRALIQDDEAHRLAEHLLLARKLVLEQPVPERPAMATRLSTDRYDVHWSAASSSPPANDAGLAVLRAKVMRWEPVLADSDLRLRLQTVGRKAALFGGLRLPDGTWLRFRAAAPDGGPVPARQRILIAFLPAGLLLLLGALLFRHTLRPMKMLVRGVNRIGRGGGETLPEAGPTEVRRVIRAFNAMQARIHQLIRDRTEALAAVGHDLRTPLARMKLRADAIDEPGLRGAFEADVAEMEGMVGSLLAFLGGEDDPEPPARIDLAVMAATLVDDALDRGHAAAYHGPDHCEAVLRPLSIKRALTNLIENAIHYGGCADVRLLDEPGRILLRVEDDGPGIAPDRLAHVLEPFARLDFARGRNTNGLGLGLAIVRKAADLEGGELRLSNRAEGGLRAELSLPARRG